MFSGTINYKPQAKKKEGNGEIIYAYCIIHCCSFQYYFHKRLSHNFTKEMPPFEIDVLKRPR